MNEVAETLATLTTLTTREVSELYSTVNNRGAGFAVGQDGQSLANGAVRVAVERECADFLEKNDPGWTFRVKAPVSRYAEVAK